MLRVNRGDHAPLAMELVQRQCAASEGVAPVFSQSAWWRWDPEHRHWAPLPEAVLKRDLAHVGQWAQWAQGSPSIATSSHFFGSVVSIAESLAHEPDWFADPTPGVAFRDCFARLTTGGRIERVPNGPDHRARWAFDFDYDESAKCDRWMDFLGQVWTRPVSDRADPDDAAQKIQCLAQFIGACLTGTAHIGQRAIMLVGAGGNGKSVLCDAVREIFPHESVCSVPPQDLRTPERVSRLASARLNVVSDIPQRGLTDTGLMKQVISGDVTDARKLYQDSFSFRPTCGHLFSANAIPATNDYSTGFQRRWIILDFPNSFLGSGVRRTTPELLEIFRRERPGIVRWALEGVQSLMAFREYVIPESSATAVRRWRMSNDQVACFMEEMLDVEGESWGPNTREIYREYEKWARESGHAPMAQRTLSERLAQLGVQYRRLGSTGRQFRCKILTPAQRRDREEGSLDEVDFDG